MIARAARATHATRVLTVLAVALAAGACGPSSIPAPTPGGLNEVVAALVFRGATITDQVAGDAGCTDATLVGNAVRLDVLMPGEPHSSPVYVFRWRRDTDYEAANGPFAQCVMEFGNRTGAESVIQIGRRPWRAYGPNWPPTLHDAVSAALFEAGAP